MIEIRGLVKVWADGTRALDGIDLAVPRGQFCVVLGPSGAGKSTLLRSINGLVRPTEGSVRVDGVEFCERTARALRRRIAMIHQHFALTLRLSVATNVLAGMLPAVSTARALLGWFTPEQRRRACEWLARVGLEPAHLHRRAGELSGGQQQRVGVARAFANDPDVVLADEPVASLDPATARDILALTRDAARERNVTVLCSLHQVDLARAFADRIVGMRAGRIVFDGAPAELGDDRLHGLYGSPLHAPEGAGRAAPALEPLPAL